MSESGVRKIRWVSKCRQPGSFFVVTENGRDFKVTVRGLYGVHRR